ncbi:MAG: hypothetical protein Tsb0033_27010 [Winogradskyella sp.]
MSVDLKETDVEDILHFNFPEDELNAYSVSKDLFSPKVDSNVESIINEINYTELIKND